MQALVEAGPPVATIVGKSWDFHVTAALGTTLDENVAMIARLDRLSPQALRGGHLRRRALLRRLQAPTATTRCATLRAAEAAGAHWLVLCDTNGGRLPQEVDRHPPEVKRAVKAETPLGIHVHNDTECAVANSLAAVGGGRRATCRGRSTATASAAATPTSSRSSPTSCSRWGSSASRRRTCASCATSRASSPSWPTASRGRPSPTWATPPSPTRAACTSPRC